MTRFFHGCLVSAAVSCYNPKAIETDVVCAALSEFAGEADLLVAGCREGATVDCPNTSGAVWSTSERVDEYVAAAAVDGVSCTIDPYEGPPLGCFEVGDTGAVVDLPVTLVSCLARPTY